MSDDETRAGQARNPQVVLDEVMNPCIGKSEHAWVASREIKRLRVMHKDLQDAVHYHRGEAERLRAELAENDKTIEDIQCELAFKRKGHFDESCEWFKDKYIITEDDIDKAWHERSGVIHPHLSAETLGIVACSGCGGSGETLERENNAVYRVHCPGCHRNGVSHGWVWKEVSDE